MEKIAERLVEAIVGKAFFYLETNYLISLYYSSIV
jgi:hypothetical protein